MKRSGIMASLAVAACALTIAAAEAQPRRGSAAQQQTDAFIAAVTHYCIANVEAGIAVNEIPGIEGYELVALTPAQAAAARMPQTSTGFRLNFARGHVLIESATGKSCQARADGAPAQATFDALGAFVTDPARGFAKSLDMSQPPTTFMRIFAKPAGEENIVVMLNGIQPRGAASMLNVTVSRSKRQQPTAPTPPVAPEPPANPAS